MSALGQKRTLKRWNRMSALPPKADVARRREHVRFVPIATKVRRNKNGLFDHLVSAAEQHRRHLDAERPRGPEIDNQIKLGRLLDRDVGGFRPA